MRRPKDFYPTPLWATAALLDRVKAIRAGSYVLEPCAGNLQIATPLRLARFDVITNDIDPIHQCLYARDASTRETWDAFPPVDWVITNPPFSHAAEILTLAYEYARVGVAFMLRLSFLEPCANRVAFLTENPLTGLHVLPRISFTGDGKTDSVTCAWMIWEKESIQQRISVIPCAVRGYAR